MKRILHATALLKFIAPVVLGVMVLSSGSCKKQETTHSTVTAQPHLFVANIVSTTTHLFYSGVIQPLKIYNVVSPVDGTVDDLYFTYGDQVQQGQVLLQITSIKSQQDYATALTDYIKDKDQYVRNKTNFEGTTALYKAGIVDRENYLSEKSQLGTSELAYINSTHALKTLISKMPGAPQNIESLTLHDVANVEKTLQQPYDKFTIAAPVSGIALIPEKTGNAANAENKTPVVGSEVKPNQVVVSIGNISGLSVTIHVSENDINKIAPDQAVVLTSAALPGVLFYGKVSTVGKQAKPNENGGIASFPVTILVPEITTEERALVKVGMNVKVDLSISNPPGIKIPIAAVFLSKGGIPTVTIMDAQTGKPRDVVVETGATDIENVTILKGLNVGDKIVVEAH